MADILITEHIDPIGPELLKAAGHRIVLAGRDMEIIRRELPRADAVIVRIVDLPGALLKTGKNLNVVSKHGVGVDNIDLDYCKKAGIAVTITPGANSLSVAEHAFTLLAALAKRIIPVSNAYRERGFSAKNSSPGTEITGKTLGILGCGRIGSRVAKMAAFGFSMKVLAYDPYLSQAPEGVELVTDRDRIFRESDFISLHALLNDETFHSVGAHELAMMKPTAYLINCGRGPLVDEAALIQALEAGQIAGAGLDVTEQEPCDPNSPLFRMDRVILTPHFAPTTQESASACSRISAQNVLDVLAGRHPAGQIV